HVNPLIKYYKNAIAHKGFGVVETICICPTYYGRQNRSGSAVEMMQRLKEDYVLNTNYEKMPEEQRQGKKVYGEFVNKILPEYIEEFDRIIADLKGETNV
ncbi:MAG: 2-oxoacid:ferredoxin oxidoreductase subunit beta, partial [Bacillota bacterium]|nr:2-oxoacid:ferredoxin oxidoreductase subunit beta [Bacillota bacterium]